MWPPLLESSCPPTLPIPLLPTTAQACGAVLEDCSISSSTGVGIGIEGGAPIVRRCTVFNCERNGVAIFGDLFDRACAAQLQGCRITNNSGNGLLVRDGAAPTVTDTALAGNGEWGLRLQDAGGRYEGCEIAGNARGSIGCSLLDESLNTVQLVERNRLDRPVQYLGGF